MNCTKFLGTVRKSNKKRKFITGFQLSGAIRLKTIFVTNFLYYAGTVGLI